MNESENGRKKVTKLSSLHWLRYIQMSVKFEIFMIPTELSLKNVEITQEPNAESTWNPVVTFSTLNFFFLFQLHSIRRLSRTHFKNSHKTTIERQLPQPLGRYDDNDSNEDVFAISSTTPQR